MSAYLCLRHNFFYSFVTSTVMVSSTYRQIFPKHANTEFWIAQLSSEYIFTPNVNVKCSVSETLRAVHRLNVFVDVRALTVPILLLLQLMENGWIGLSGRHVLSHVEREREVETECV